LVLEEAAAEFVCTARTDCYSLWKKWNRWPCKTPVVWG